MEENNVTNAPAEAPKKERNFKAAVKEWFRKQTVSLKRAPQRIPLVFTVIVSMLWLIWAFTTSSAIYGTTAVAGTGIAMFITTLLSILVIPMYLNAFPKRKKANPVFIALIFVFLAIIIGCQVVYYVLESNYAAEQGANYLANNPVIGKSLTLTIVHIALVGISAVILATMPLYKKLILKINTRKVIEENVLKEEIDTSEEEG